jgi:hypothetical protein
LTRLRAIQSAATEPSLWPSARISAGTGPGAPGGVREVTMAWIARPPWLRTNFTTMIAPGILVPVNVVKLGKLIV